MDADTLQRVRVLQDEINHLRAILGSPDLDGGAADSEYLASQVIDGGNSQGV